MNDRIGLARAAQREALAVRRSARVDRLHPLCVYDLAESLGVEVRFRPETSLNGMYVKGSRGLILISTTRPQGRQAFTCAHELGHHVFEHGTRVDEYVLERTSQRRSPEEFMADMFAAYLLMPPSVVTAAFKQRGWSIQRATPQQIYAISSLLGVGYDTLIQHLRWTLEAIPASTAEALAKVSPKNIKSSILGAETTANLVIADHLWVGRPLDIQVGDVVRLLGEVEIEGESAVVSRRSAAESIITGLKPGISRVELSVYGWSSYIRVSRKNFVGRSIFRHLEDADDD